MNGPQRGDNPGVQSRLEREEFARGHVPAGTAPVPPRAAATIVVARPATPGFEVLLLERPASARFAAGAFVFPGGVVDPDDAEAAREARLPAVPEPAACVAAVRELFEETGMLLGRFRASPRTLAEARTAVLADARPFSDVAREISLDLRAAQIAYFARWITPRRLARRYDTRFFLSEPSPDAATVALTEEHVSARWEPPARALARCAAGELPMLFPTRKTLERLHDYASLAAALTGLSGRSVELTLAKLAVDGDRVRPLMPGDAGYDEAY